MDPKVGILINNLGTPDSPTPSAVGRYLREFLMDPYILSAPHFIRWLLVNLVIVPRRRFYSAANYAKIWTDHGSPLKTHSTSLVDRLRVRPELSSLPIALGMRYGSPSIEEALKVLVAEGVERVLFVPLYPQFAEATTTSAVEKMSSIVKKLYPGLKWGYLEPFFQQSYFIDSIAKEIRRAGPIEHLLLSYHGLPIRQLSKSNSQCKGVGDCSLPLREGQNASCYRAQCFETSRLLTEALGIESSRVSTSFQSRLGPVKWIQPYTEDTLIRLARSGVRRLTVACPSFVADCLETLEEIGMGARDTFREHGGEDLTLVPCLNDSIDWTSGLAHALKEKVTGEFHL